MVQSSNPSSKPPFLAFVKDEADLAVLRAFAQKHGFAAASIQAGDVNTAAESLKSGTPPTVLMVEIGGAAEAEAQLEKLSTVCDPDTKVITIGSVNEYSFYCWLMDLGLSSYLLKPLSEKSLEGAYEKAVAPPPSAASGEPEKKQARLVGVMGVRGGAGATSLSLLISAVLAQRSGGKVALMDPDPQDGSIALLMDVEPARGFRDALEKPDRIDSLFFDRVMQKTDLGFDVLAAEEALHDNVHYHDQAAETLLKELRGRYDYLVLDMPRRSHPFFFGMLKQCDPLLMVSEMSLTGVRDCLRYQDMLREQLKITSPRIIAGRSGQAGKYEMATSDFESGIKAKLSGVVPFSPELFSAIGPDMKLAKFHGNATLKAVEKLVEDLILPSDSAPVQSGGKGHKNLLGLFKKGG